MHVSSAPVLHVLLWCFGYVYPGSTSAGCCPRMTWHVEGAIEQIVTFGSVKQLVNYIECGDRVGA